MLASAFNDAAPPLDTGSDCKSTSGVADLPSGVVHGSEWKESDNSMMDFLYFVANTPMVSVLYIKIHVSRLQISNFQNSSLTVAVFQPLIYM